MYLNMHIKIQGGPSFPSPQSMAPLALCQELQFCDLRVTSIQKHTDVEKNVISGSS